MIRLFWSQRPTLSEIPTCRLLKHKSQVFLTDIGQTARLPCNRIMVAPFAFASYVTCPHAKLTYHQPCHLSTIDKQDCLSVLSPFDTLTPSLSLVNYTPWHSHDPEFV